MFGKLEVIGKNRGFFLGFAAVLLWGTLGALSRSLIEQLGKFTAGGVIYVAGGLACFLLYPPHRRRFVWRYHGVCGGLLLAYFVLFSIGLGLTADRVQAVEMNLINYLWPLLTLVFSVILFKKRTSLPVMMLGMLLAFCGFALSSSALAGIPLKPAALWNNFCNNPLPYLMMTGAAVSWGLYSNILAALDEGTPTDAMPVFMIVSGALLFLMRYPFGESSAWSLAAFGELAAVAFFPIAGGYFCWDRAMLTKQRDSAIIFSYFTPLFSGLCYALLLDVKLPLKFYAACLLVIAGALLSRAAIRKEK